MEFPGVITADTLDQIRQNVEGWYSNQNPYWHTRTIGLFLKLGTALTGDLHIGVALASFAQILLLAFTFSYSLTTLYQRGIPKPVILLCWVAYALFPYNIAYSVTLWKDIPFSAASLLFTTALYRILFPVSGSRKKDFLLLLLAGAGLCLWRTNGLLVFIMMLPFLFLARKRTLSICATLLFLVCCYLEGPYLTSQGINGSDYVEAMSMPLQQICRVVQEQKSLSEEDLELIEAVADPETIAATYDSHISDPVKGMVRKSPAYESIADNPGPYISLYLRLGMQYPAEYFKAWVDQTKGYWNGGYEYWFYATGILDNSLGLVSKTEGSIFYRLYHALVRYMTLIELTQPIISIGLYSMTIVVCCFVSCMQKRKEWLLTLPCLAVLAGLLIGTPVFSEFRYAYPCMIACPFLLPLTLFCDTSRKNR